MFNPRFRRVVYGAALVVACTLDGPRAKAPASQSAPTVDSTPRPLSFSPTAVVEQIRHRFRADGPGFLSAGGEYAVRVEDGAVGVRVPGGGTLRLRFDRARVGGAPMALEPVPASPVVDGARLTFRRTLVDESLSAGPESVEQSWTLRGPVAGELVLLGAVTGMEHVASLPDGLRFRDAATGATIRYGHATVRDAGGREIHVDSTFEDGAIALRVPEGFLAGARYPVVIDPTIGPETAVGSSPYGPKPSWQYQPEVSFDGTNFLVAWIEYLSGGFQYLGARVTKTGTVLDQDGFVIARFSGSGGASLSLTFDGSGQLAVFTDAGFPNNVRAARIAPTGSVLDQPPLSLTSDTAGFSMRQGVRAARLGKNVLAVWAESGGSGQDIYGRLVASDGSLASAVMVISGAGGNQTAPSLATHTAAGMALVAWQDDRNGFTNGDIFGTRVTAAGVVLDPLGVAIAGAASNQGQPSVAVNDAGRFLVAYMTGTFAASDVFATRVEISASSLNVLDAAGFPVNTATQPQFDPAARSDGTDFLVTWTDRRSGSYDVWAARVQTGGTVLPDSVTGFPVSAVAGVIETESALAFDGTSFLAVWQDGRSGSADVFAVRIPPVGSAATPPEILVTTGPSGQSGPVVASSGTGYFVVWADGRNASTGLDLFGTRVDGTGTVLDPSGVVISNAPGTQDRPRVAFTSGNYLVVWRDFRSGGSFDVYGSRVSTAGVVKDPTGAELAIAVGPGTQTNPSVSANGGQFLVAWEAFGLGFDIQASRVTVGGAVTDRASPIPVSGAASSQTASSSASNGTDFLVAWTDNRAGNSDIYATRVVAPLTGPSTVQDPSGIGVSTHTAGAYEPSVTFGGGFYLVAWRDDRLTGSAPDIFAARISPLGMLMDGPSSMGGIVVDSTVLPQTTPAAGFDGANFLVVWEDGRGGGTNRDLYGTRMSPTAPVGGPPLDIPAFPVATGASTLERVPSLARGAGGQMLVAYDSPRGGVTKSFFRLYAPCSPASCSDGNPCTDDVCDVTTTSCKNPNNTSACADDGNACTTDVCAAGSCTHPAKPACCNVAADCNDSNGCTTDSCSGPGGACSHVKAPGCCNVAADCSDGNPCTADSCSGAGGTCAYTPIGGCCSAAADCSDGNLCTTDVCGAGGLCSNTKVSGCCNTAADCNDANLCTTDSCSGAGGTCAHAKVSGCCNAAADCADGNLCTGDVCSGPGGACTNPKTAGCCNLNSECNDSNPCTADVCSGPGGSCSHPKLASCCNAAADCNDLDVCTADACSGPGGACSNARIALCCRTAGDCDDGNLCTADACSAPGGTCSHARVAACCNVNADCSDGNACTTDVCSGPGGTCANVKAAGCCNANTDCGDGDACTADTCSGPGGTCSRAKIAGCCNANADCADGNACTADACAGPGGACSNPKVAGCCNVPADCDDGNPCTTDACSGPGGSCSHVKSAGCCATASDCADSDACTVDLCSAPGGSCSNPRLAGCCNVAADCNDGNACTADACPGGKCTSTRIAGCCATAADCDDGNSCTADACSGGKCASSPIAGCCKTASDCKDANACTTDSCGAGGLCANAKIAGCCNAAADCSDGNACTTDTCTGPGGTCKTAPIASCCNTAADCADADACTSDVCSGPGGACSHPRITGCCAKDLDCDDGNACTKDACSGGKCARAPVAGCCVKDADCNDANACTADSCGAGGLCANAKIAGCCVTSADCDDKNSCTTEACTGARCVSLPVAGCCTKDADCSDGNACTADTCGAGGLCGNAKLALCCNEAADCDDTDACTADACSGPGGTCTHAKAAGCCQANADCDDKDACTADLCSGPGGKCASVKLASCCNTVADCDDQNACTKDSCSGPGGSCARAAVAGCCNTVADCQDSDECTLDLCSGAGGACSHPRVPRCCKSPADCGAGGACVDGTCVAPDAGAPADAAASTTDAGKVPAPDGSEPGGTAPPPSISEGCHCSASARAGPSALLFVFAAATLRRRRAHR